MLRWRREERREKKQAASLQPASTQELINFVREINGQKLTII
jgi:hypothetical protein